MQNAKELKLYSEHQHLTLSIKWQTGISKILNNFLWLTSYVAVLWDTVMGDTAATSVQSEKLMPSSEL